MFIVQLIWSFLMEDSRNSGRLSYADSNSDDGQKIVERGEVPEVDRHFFSVLASKPHPMAVVESTLPL